MEREILIIQTKEKTSLQQAVNYLQQINPGYKMNFAKIVKNSNNNPSNASNSQNETNAPISSVSTAVRQKRAR